MLEAHWWALVQGATICTLLWLFVPEWLNDPRGDRSRLWVTTMTAAALWFTAAVTADDLTRYTPDGTAVATDAGVLGIVCVALGALSTLTFLLFLFDGYPPDTHRLDATAETQQTPQTDTQPND